MFDDERKYYVTQIAQKLDVTSRVIYKHIKDGSIITIPNSKPMTVKGSEINRYLGRDHGKH